MSRIRLEKELLLSEKRRELMDLFNRAKPLQAEIHIASNPFLPVEEMKIDTVLGMATELKRCVRKILKLAAEIKELKADLGIDDE